MMGIREPVGPNVFSLFQKFIETAMEPIQPTEHEWLVIKPLLQKSQPRVDDRRVLNGIF
jgi:hypothetical protein